MCRFFSLLSEKKWRNSSFVRLRTDVNECDQFQIDCGNDRTCFNTRGAYECVDVPCPIGYIRQNRTDCMLKCVYRSTSSCSHRRAMFIRYRFIALTRLIFPNEILFRIPLIDDDKHEFNMILNDRNSNNSPLPFVLDRFDLKNTQPLLETSDYEFEIEISSNFHRNRRRLHTIYLFRIHISPFHF